MLAEASVNWILDYPPLIILGSGSYGPQKNRPDLPMNSMAILHSYVTKYQRVYIYIYCTFSHVRICVWEIVCAYHLIMWKLSVVFVICDLKSLLSLAKRLGCLLCVIRKSSLFLRTDHIQQRLLHNHQRYAPKQPTECQHISNNQRFWVTQGNNFNPPKRLKQIQLRKNPGTKPR